MKSQTRRHFPVEMKMQTVRDSWKPNANLTDIVQKLKITRQTLYQWREMFPSLRYPEFTKADDKSKYEINQAPEKSEPIELNAKGEPTDRAVNFMRIESIGEGASIPLQAPPEPKGDNFIGFSIPVSGPQNSNLERLLMLERHYATHYKNMAQKLALELYELKQSAGER